MDRDSRELQMRQDIGVIETVAFSVEEVRRVLSQIKPDKSPGPDGIPGLIPCLEIWTRALEEGFEVDVVYIDFRKASDTVPHQRLLHKLSAIGIRGDLMDWIRAFLVGRKQRVCVGDDMSEWVNVTSGVPQGSVLGPLLFILYINDSLQELDCGKIMFADDVKLWQVIKGLNDQRFLQDNLHRLQAWSKKWLLDFNVEKCAILHLRPTNSHSNESLRAYHLKDIRHQRGDLILVYKIIHGLEYGLKFEDMFQWHLSPNLRGHSMKLRATMSRLNLRSEFFTQRVVEKLNDLPQSVVEATSLQLFKKRLDDYLCPLFSLDSLNLN
nr:unnamed protein product [Spirometra erinaceieuropaei]